MRKFIIALLLFCSTSAIATQTGDEFTRPLGTDLKKGFDYNFSEIRREYGEAAVKVTGDAANYVGRVCYFTSDDSAVFEFYRTELSYGFAFRLPNPQDRVDCSPTQRRLSSNDLNVNGVKLGLKRKTYESLIGHTSTSPGITVKNTSTSISHDFSRKEPFTSAETEAEQNRYKGLIGKRINGRLIQASDFKEGYWDIDIYLHAKFSAVGLISFDVSYSAQN